MRDSKLFDRAIVTYFEPLALKQKLPLTKVEDGIYEISSQFFILRIRLDTGHHRGLNVLLRERSIHPFDESKLGSELGIGCFIEFHGENPSDTLIAVESDQDFSKQAQLLAAAAVRFALPYLQGDGSKWKAVYDMVQKKTAQNVEKIKEYRFPKNVVKK